MIVEFPDRSCILSPYKHHRMTRARRRFIRNCGSVSSSSWTNLKGSVVIKGVGFWDAVHGQTGAVPNGIEPHPVLDIDGGCSKRKPYSRSASRPSHARPRSQTEAGDPVGVGDRDWWARELVSGPSDNDRRNASRSTHFDVS